MDDVDTIITQALKESNLAGYTGKFNPLGGGEINDTYLLNFNNDQKIVLRIARYEDQTSLRKEAHSLGLLDIQQVPKLLYFDEQSRINNRLWILESYIPGAGIDRLNREQLNSLGALLARVHKVTGEEVGINVWQDFLVGCNKFGDEQKLLNYPEPILRELIVTAKSYFESQQEALDHVKPVLVHGDATPSNILVQGSEVSLIDWEFARFKDPMAEFSTIYYEDMEYNKGKWRMHITADERGALFSGYQNAGGSINEERIKLWMIHDKLGAAVFLHWRIYESGRPASDKQIEQYRLDLGNLMRSLQNELM